MQKFLTEWHKFLDELKEEYELKTCKHPGTLIINTCAKHEVCIAGECIEKEKEPEDDDIGLPGEVTPT